jgi:spermidine synthase
MGCHRCRPFWPRPEHSTAAGVGLSEPLGGQSEPIRSEGELDSPWYARPTIPHLLIAEDEGRRALIVDGAVQSVAPEDGHRGSGYWAAMIPDVRPQRALVLGLGAGTVVHLLTRRFGPIPIVAVDDDPELVEFARREFDLDLANLEIVIGDAFAYVQACEQRFGLILVDLYHGAQPAAGLVSRPFLSELKRLLLPRGQVVFNLYGSYLTPKRMAALQTGFRTVTSLDAGANRIVFCR